LAAGIAQLTSLWFCELSRRISTGELALFTVPAGFKGARFHRQLKQRAELSFTEPWMFDYPVSFGLIFTAGRMTGILM